MDTINYEKAALDMSRYGLNNLYGYLSAPSIDLYLPVYLGANDSMMSYGAAHLSGTSLPIDEKNTNVAIAGHTGYIGRIFFDNIKRLDLGDTVSFTNYWETIDYEVIDFKTVAPNETGDIYIKDGRQLMTLITCTPDGHGGFGRHARRTRRIRTLPRYLREEVKKQRRLPLFFNCPHPSSAAAETTIRSEATINFQFSILHFQFNKGSRSATLSAALSRARAGSLMQLR